MKNKRSLGQNWLKDRATLTNIAEYAIIGESTLEKGETVLEIGPGLGTLTSVLFKFFDKVVAVEYDAELAKKLPGQFPGKNLEVLNEDFLQFDLGRLPKGYKVVANVPYYITSKIVQRLMTADNKPSRAVLLVQKEVAERLAAGPGELSILGISAQVYSKVGLGEVVKAEMFTPPPKVDSQVVVFDIYEKSLIADMDEAEFFKVVKMGFSAPRKKVVSNLAAGLRVDKSLIAEKLEKLGIDSGDRPQDLSIESWKNIVRELKDI